MFLFTKDDVMQDENYIIKNHQIFFMIRMRNYLIYIFFLFLPIQTMYIVKERFLNGIKWQYGSGVLYLSEFILWLIIFIQLLIWAKQKKPINLRLDLKNLRTLFVFIIWLLIFLTGLSVLFSVHRQVSFWWWFKLLEITVLLFILLNAKINRKKIMLTLVVAGLIESFFIYWQFVVQHINPSVWLGISKQLPQQLGTIIIPFADGRFLRPYGTFTHPNIAGGFLAFTALLCLYLIIKERKINPRLYLTVGGVIIATAMFLTFSRGAVLGFVISVFFLMIFSIYGSRGAGERQNKFVSVKTGLIFLFLIIILFVVLWPVASSRLTIKNRIEKISVNERADQLIQFKQVIKSNWLTGVGIGAYTYYLYEQVSDRPAYDYQPVHNIFLLIISEVGILAVVLFLVLILYFFYIFKNCNIKNADELLFGLLSLFIVVSMVDHYFWTSYVGLLMSCLILYFMLNSTQVNFSSLDKGEKGE